MSRTSVVMSHHVHRTVWLLAAAMLGSACTGTGSRHGDTAGSAWENSRQLILVTTADWNSNQGHMQSFRRSLKSAGTSGGGAITGGGWQPVGVAEPVTIGRSGSAWGLGLHGAQPGAAKREGDGRAPAGVFRIGTAFGYAKTSTTDLPYQPMSASHYCVDVSGSPLYNRIVDADVVGRAAIAGSTEPMRLDIHGSGDQRYKSGLVIEHNSAGQAGAGSCIFAHLWKQPGHATSGCTAMAEAVMERLQGWLDPQQQPIFVLLPQAEYARLQTAWQLPAVDAR